jgi:hypothetical protein
MSTFPEKLMWILFQILVLSITVYGLLCTIYSDVIIQNDNEFFNISALSMPDKNIEKEFDEIIEEKVNKKDEKKESENIEKNEKLYIFVFDISGSALNKKMNNNQVNYIKRIKEIEDEYDKRISLDGSNNTLNFSKLRLLELLSDFYYNSHIYKDDYLSIWTLGDNGILQYPLDSRKTKIDEAKIVEAAKKISSLEIKKPDKITNFVKLFEKFELNYGDEFKEDSHSIFDTTEIIITFISDLLHDVDKEENIDIYKNWQELEKYIEEFCKSRIKVNLIVLSDLDSEKNRSIYPILRSNLEGHRLNKEPLEDEKKPDSLFPIRYAKNKIEFYYTNQKDIIEASQSIKVPGKKDDRIRISIVGEDNTSIIPRISFYCEISEPGQNKRIFSNENYFDSKLKEANRIKFKNNNRFFLGNITPLLKISIYNERTSFLIPICFIKKLPNQAVIIFKLLQKLIIFSLLFMLFLAVISARPVWLILLSLSLMLIFIFLII